jgi:trehalose 6-phosphate synthase
MSRLIVVSNRVADLEKGAQSGGLAVALGDALKKEHGLWFGWDGNILGNGGRLATNLREQEGVTFATTPLTREEYDNYYLGFSNNVLWPAFHYRIDLTNFETSFVQGYRKVNQRLAQALAPLVEKEDRVWVHDYHLIPLGGELRRAGVNVPIGFFLHVPFPSFDVMRSLPCYLAVLNNLSLYDVVGFQTERDLRAFHSCLTQPEISGEVLDDGRVSAFGRTFRAEVFPIGIDVDGCASLAQENMSHSKVTRLAKSVGSRRLVIGVDRLDYSKGLELRFRAFERLLSRYPSSRGEVSLLQIAPPTRAGVRTYDTIRARLEQAAGNVNGKYADIDWVPIRYLNQAYDRDVLMSLYRLAAVGLVTPIRDGMNLVAKEYVASQDPEDPGMLVLSTLAGAASELSAAVLVNPYDRDGVADGLATAIEMARGERQERHQEMIAILKKNDIHAWCNGFLSALAEATAGAE